MNTLMKIVVTISIVTLCPVLIAAQEQIIKEIRLVNPTTPRFPLVLRSSASATAQQNITLPASLPSVGQVLQASAVSGADVTTTWATPAAGSGSSHTVARNTATVGSTDETNYTTVTDMNLAVSASTTYVIDGLIVLDNSSDDHNTDIQVSFPSGTATITMYRLDGNDDYIGIDQSSPLSLTDVNTDDNQRIYRICGVLYVDLTGGNLQFLFRRNSGGNGSDQSRIMSGSYWSIGR